MRQQQHSTTLLPSSNKYMFWPRTWLSSLFALFCLLINLLFFSPSAHGGSVEMGKIESRKIDFKWLCQNYKTWNVNCKLTWICQAHSVVVFLFWFATHYHCKWSPERQEFAYQNVSFSSNKTLCIIYICTWRTNLRFRCCFSFFRYLPIECAIKIARAPCDFILCIF